MWSESGHTPMLPTGEVYGRRRELCSDRASREQLEGKSLALHRLRGREAERQQWRRSREIQMGRARNDKKGKPEPPLRTDEGKEAHVSACMRPPCKVGQVVRPQKRPEGDIWKTFQNLKNPPAALTWDGQRNPRRKLLQAAERLSPTSLLLFNSTRELGTR